MCVCVCVCVMLIIIIIVNRRTICKIIEITLYSDSETIETDKTFHCYNNIMYLIYYDNNIVYTEIIVFFSI